MNYDDDLRWKEDAADVEILIKCGVDTDVSDNSDETELHIATNLWNIDSVEEKDYNYSSVE